MVFSVIKFNSGFILMSSNLVAWNHPYQEDRDSFIGPWGTLCFHLALTGFIQIVVFKMFHTRGQQVLFNWRDGGRVTSPLAKNLLIPPPAGKVSLPVDFLHKIFYPPNKVYIPTKKQCSCFNSIQMWPNRHCSCTIFVLSSYSSYTQGQCSISTECYF